MNHDLILWDWNGTLFDDVAWCIRTINAMLARRNMKPLDGIAAYQQAFCFPVINYYRNVGFDFTKESFEALADEYITLYHSAKTGGSQLYDGAERVLRVMRERGIAQVVLSATKTDHLLSQMKEFDILYYFDKILGLPDIYASSKIDVGLDYMSRKKVRRAVLIGDTEHDAEVARSLCVDCLLIANGHQSRERLTACGAPVLENIAQVIEYIH